MLDHLLQKYATTTDDIHVDELNSAHMTEKMENEEDKLQFHDSDLKSPIGADPAGSLISEQISTEDTELSSTCISVNINKAKDVPVELNSKCGVTSAVSINRPSSVEKEQPRPLCALLPSSMETCQSFTSICRSQESLKTTTVHTEPDKADLCAAVLLACLFCHPLDCLLATMTGCNECVGSLCSFMCGCDSTALQTLTEITSRCDLCGCLGVRCVLCDCPICDICLQTTECLDLAMEISQMLYH